MRYSLFVLFVFLFSCNKSYDVFTPVEIMDFSGAYICAVTDDILEPQYDSIGNYIGVHRKPWHFVDTFTITQFGTSDSFSVSKLRKGRGKVICVGHAKSNKLILDEDWSSNTVSDWLRGSLELREDSIILDYEWNVFSTWSTGALPYTGQVSGHGVR